MEKTLEIHNLKKSYASHKSAKENRFFALNGIELELNYGEVLGIVGESGSGKTTLGKVIVGEERFESGEVIFNGIGIESLINSNRNQFRQRVQMIRQDPFTSMNPRFTMFRALTESPLLEGIYPHEAERLKAIGEVVASVGLSTTDYGKLCARFSGGQLQRISIARALLLKPSLLICDEITSSLDVSIQAQVINVLKRSQILRAFSLIFISHDLALVSQICQKVAVMHSGQIVETGTVHQVFSQPRHPYTASLISAIPMILKKRSNQSLLNINSEDSSDKDP